MRRILVLAALATILAGCVSVEDVPKTEGADRTVAVQMRDNHFEPDELEVRRGETIAFRFTNRGSVRHDAFIGDAEEQKGHEREARMADDDEHGGGHGGEESTAITLEPGGRATLTYTFDERGEILIGCHEPGHYEDGMVAKITVE